MATVGVLDAVVDVAGETVGKVVAGDGLGDGEPLHTLGSHSIVVEGDREPTAMTPFQAAITSHVPSCR